MLTFDDHPESKPSFRGTDGDGNLLSKEQAIEMSQMYAGRLSDSLRGYNG